VTEGGAGWNALLYLQFKCGRWQAALNFPPGVWSFHVNAAWHEKFNLQLAFPLAFLFWLDFTLNISDYYIFLEHFVLKFQSKNSPCRAVVFCFLFRLWAKHGILIMLRVKFTLPEKEIKWHGNEWKGRGK